jgi:AcrR family transcriptional regulator
MHSFQPRKKPIQGRSRATVEAILEGTIRVLLDEGFETLTTTRVAEVAGVGVGTLYQYFPAKESLLFALLEREMTTLEAELLGAIAATEEQSVEARVTATIDALVRHKRAFAELGVVLQAHMPRFDGIRVVRATVRRIVSALAAMIRPSLPASMDEAEVQLIAMTVATAVQGAIDGALDLSAATLRRPAFREALVRLVLGYLRESGATLSPAQARPALRARPSPVANTTAKARRSQQSAS